MDNENKNITGEVKPETKPCPIKCDDKCDDKCDNNCKIKNIAFLEYQYRPTTTEGIESKCDKSSVVGVCLEKISFKMFKLSCKESTEPGDIILYRVVVINTGNVPLINVRLSDNLDNDTSYVPNSASVMREQGGNDVPIPFVVNPGDPLVIIATPPLLPGEMFIFSYKVLVDNSLENNTIRNNATVTHSRDPIGQSDFVEIPVRFARVDINKSVYPVNTNCVKCGDNLTYRIRLTHSGTIPAINLVVTDLFDTEFCFDKKDVTIRNKAGQVVTNGVNINVDGNLLTVNIATLPVGEIYTITVDGEICCCN